MSTTQGIISIDKEEYFKTYFQERQNLHIHLVQQLLAKAEVKKQLVNQQASEMIEKFVEYRDEFLRNLPPQIKSMSVKDYVNKYDCNFQKCMASIKADEPIQIQNTQKSLNSQPEESISFSKQISSETTFNENKPLSENENNLQLYHDQHEEEQSVFEMYTKQENKEPFKVLTNREEDKNKFVSKQNAEIYPPAKSSKKRNRENFEEAVLKENRNVLNTPSSKNGTLKAITWSATKVLNAMNKVANSSSKPILVEKKMMGTPAQTNKGASKIASPSRKPWMP